MKQGYIPMVILEVDLGERQLRTNTMPLSHCFPTEQEALDEGERWIASKGGKDWPIAGSRVRGPVKAHEVYFSKSMGE